MWATNEPQTPPGAQESSRDCFKTACAAHLANLDAKSLVTTAVVSVSSDLQVVQFVARQGFKGWAL